MPSFGGLAYLASSPSFLTHRIPRACPCPSHTCQGTYRGLRRTCLLPIRRDSSLYAPDSCSHSISYGTTTSLALCIIAGDSRKLAHPPAGYRGAYKPICANGERFSFGYSAQRRVQVDSELLLTPYAPIIPCPKPGHPNP